VLYGTNRYGLGALDNNKPFLRVTKKLEVLSTTTLNSFKVNHKACIPGLELGLDAPFNFAEMHKHLKILSFHF